MALKPSDFHVLLVLHEGPLHGYGIMKQVERQSNGEVRLEIGSLYRLIGRMLEEGLIEEGGGDDRRRLYQLTRSGRRALKAEAARLAGLLALMRARKLLPEGDS
jgi:PadR family transcriptional regulator, regulatory protein PadR